MLGGCNIQKPGKAGAGHPSACSIVNRPIMKHNRAVKLGETLGGAMKKRDEQKEPKKGYGPKRKGC